METLKTTKEYTIFKKRSGRFGVRAQDRKWINGEEKIKILLKEKLIKLAAPKPKEEPKVEAAPAAEAPKEEAKATPEKKETPKTEAKPAADAPKEA